MTNQGLREMTKTQTFNVIKSSKGHEIMEIHDHQRPERTWHIEAEAEEEASQW